MLDQNQVIRNGLYAPIIEDRKHTESQSLRAYHRCRELHSPPRDRDRTGAGGSLLLTGLGDLHAEQRTGSCCTQASENLPTGDQVAHGDCGDNG